MTVVDSYSFKYEKIFEGCSAPYILKLISIQHFEYLPHHRHKVMSDVSST
jgi:hypothetical protein